MISFGGTPPPRERHDGSERDPFHRSISCAIPTLRRSASSAAPARRGRETRSGDRKPRQQGKGMASRSMIGPQSAQSTRNSAIPGSGRGRSRCTPYRRRRLRSRSPNPRPGFGNRNSHKRRVRLVTPRLSALCFAIVRANGQAVHCTCSSEFHLPTSSRVKASTPSACKLMVAVRVMLFPPPVAIGPIRTGRPVERGQGNPPVRHYVNSVSRLYDGAFRPEFWPICPVSARRRVVCGRGRNPTLSARTPGTEPQIAFVWAKSVKLNRQRTHQCRA